MNEPTTVESGDDRREVETSLREEVENLGRIVDQQERTIGVLSREVDLHARALGWRLQQRLIPFRRRMLAAPILRQIYRALYRVLEIWVDEGFLKIFSRAGDKVNTFTVVGVIRDLVHGGPLSTRREPAVFMPLRIDQYDLNSAMAVVMRPSASPPDLAAQLRRAAQGVSSRVLVERIRTSDEMFGTAVVTPRRRTVLLGLLGGLGFTLALVGVFGMTAYSVARRTSEIGVRMAFGARPGQVVMTMVRDAAWPIALGTVAGVGGALLATQLIKSFLFAADNASHSQSVIGCGRRVPFPLDQIHFVRAQRGLKRARLL